MTLFMYGVHQVTLRANYKKLNGIVSPTVNDGMFLIGMVSMFCLPMIGIFDTFDYLPWHMFFTGTFFTAFAAYMVFYTGSLYWFKP